MSIKATSSLLSPADFQENQQTNPANKRKHAKGGLHYISIMLQHATALKGGICVPVQPKFLLPLLSMMHLSEAQASLEPFGAGKRDAVKNLTCPLSWSWNHIPSQRGSLDAFLRLCICVSHAESHFCWSDENMCVSPAAVVLQYSSVSGTLASSTMH